ncbi:ABC transporter ATP-binding protein [Metabacillus malikii]|uniref:ABC-type multidrug transport system ATPase subunit n=1 Tax=Metabacillus malikii TaxID=1504265 RepID=A0ABT9ZMW4_9BACI|nr:ABC transporter ATP-binding protein [Metabacillus malikii]MDQ0232878.1 ABC-type multidrug transport system ATPase subunit [Metabacillus malikii]
MSKLVELKQISKEYGNKKVLHDISLTIEENQVIAVLGGNGSGKSTILRIISGLERPSSGKVVYTNKGFRIGYVPDRFPKMLRFTPGEYLHYVGRIGGISEEDLNKRIPNLLRRFQLEEMNHKWIMHLSKGNIQKVGIIQAIIQKPDLFILDEPVSGLDIHAQQELVTVIKELKEQGGTILLTYHESHMFDDVIETTYYLNQGVISKTNTLVYEQIKLVEVKRIEESIVKGWNEVLHIENKENSLLLYVGLENSDTILSRVLQLQGSIDRVSTIVVDENDQIGK